MSRSSNLFKNSTYGVITQILNSVAAFICRTVFINTLGSTYLGVGGLFQNVLSVLSLAELGIGSAMTYSLYKPLADSDEIAVSKYMNLYAKAYQAIGLIISLLGLLLTPFLNYIISDIEAVPNIRLIYVMYILNAGSSYLMSYRKTLFEADQHNYIVLIIQSCATILMNVVQIFALVFVGNYIVYFSIGIVTGIVSNIFIYLYGEKKYPYLKKYRKEKLNPSEKKRLTRHIAAMMSHKVGSVVVNGTDNIIISSVLGLSTVGVYSNYTTIINMVKSFFNPVLSSFMAGIGNLNAQADKEKSYAIFQVMYLFEYWLNGFAGICFFVLFPPFIQLWIGNDYQIATPVLFIIVINYYVTAMRHPVITYNTTLGLFWNDRFKPWAEAAVNLIFSLILVRVHGLVGVFEGTLISSICVCWWLEPYLLYKHQFKKNVCIYLGKYIYDFLMLCFWGVIVQKITYIFSNFILQLIVCIITTNLYFWFRCHKSFEFGYMVNAMKTILKSKIRRG